MPLGKRNPLRKVPRDIRAACLKSLRKQLFRARTAENIASKELFGSKAELSEEGGRALSKWESAYKERRDAQRMIELVRRRPKRK